MNEPFRYKGYTLYQTSYIEGGARDGSDVSVLAAVWNVGRLFPYVSGLLMAFGLGLHVWLRIQKTSAPARWEIAHAQ